MIVSRKILEQWIDIKKIKDYEIADALNNLGFEVEKVINLICANTNLIVGEIVKVEKHPQSNQLNLCHVNIGKKNLKIICGANNVKNNIKVVVAQINSKLANGMIIDSREIRGFISQGMICSLSELGLNPEVQSEEDLKGIIHLPTNALIGSLKPLSYLNLDDTIFEIQLTLNRSDCLAMYYLAQELSNYFKLPLTKIALSNFKNIKNEKLVNNNKFVKALATLKINLLNNNDLVSNPTTLRTLQLANIKPKDFFSDLLNLVMLELGQPVAVFNSHQILDFKVDLAQKDNISKTLRYFKGDILFSNEKQPFSNLAELTLENYQVNSSVKSLLFLSLNLDNQLVKKQIKHNNFNTNNNVFLQRLMKPVVPTNYLLVLKRLLFLFKQFGVKFEIVNFVNQVNYKEQNSSWILINYQRINQILGTNLSLATIIKALQAIGCQVGKKSKFLTNLKVKIPNYRRDLNNINDFSEELARIIGYDKIPSTKPNIVITPFAFNNLTVLLNNLRSYLLHYGFHQVKTYNLTSKEVLSDFNFFNYKKPFSLISPINLTRKVMRFSLIPSLLEICYVNTTYKQDNLKVFCDEVIYNNDDTNYNHHLAFVVNSNLLPKQTNSADTFALVKGFLTAWLNKNTNQYFSDNLEYQSFKNDKTHPYLSAHISHDNVHFATIAALHPRENKILGLDNNLFLVEINCTKLAKVIADFKKTQSIKFKNWSKFNPLSRDLSIIVSKEINYVLIKDAIWTSQAKYLKNLTLIDVYDDAALTKAKKYSLTFNLEFNDKNMQLDENKVSQEIQLIQTILKTKFQATIR